MSTVSRVKGVAVRSLLVLAVLLAGFYPLVTHAQNVTGSIQGSVLDASGAAVPDAEITVTNTNTGVARTTTATSDGLYSVPSLQPGVYTVEAKAQGFSPVQVKNITVNVGSNARVDLSLQVGQVTQSVTITEAVPTVETQSAEVSQIMTEDLIKNIPLNARDLQQLQVIQPGVQQTFTSSFGKQVSMGGDRVANNRYLQEGVDLTWTFRTSPVSLASNILMGADAVKEFKVLTENPSVEYGELSGGVTSTTLKSGTNSLHGTAFESYRNDKFDAANYFDTNGAAPLRRHQYGGSIGGPIRKDKTFFFTDYEGYWANTGFSFLSGVPNMAARTAATTDPTIQQIFFGGTGGNGPNPLFPKCQSDNSLATGVIGICNYANNPVQQVRENYGVVKIDHQLTSKNSISSSYNIDQSTQYFPTQLNITADDIYMRRQVFSLADTHIFSPAIVNTARVGIHRIYYGGTLDLVPGVNVDSRLFVNKNPFIVAQTPFPQLPAISIGGGVQSIGGPALGFNYVPRFIGYTNIYATDTANYIVGKHAFAFGIQYKHWNDNIENYMSTPRGAYTFGTLNQFLTNSPATSFAWWVQNYTDPLNGQTYNSNFPRFMSLHSWGVFAEDTYKIKTNLTVTLGLRWEYTSAPSEKYNQISNLYARDGSCTPYTCATPTVGGPWYNPPKDNFAPRIGFNWDPFKDGKTSIRAGAGVFFQEMADDTWYPSLASQPPFSIAVSLPNAVKIPFLNTNGSSNDQLNTFLSNNGSSIFKSETYGGAENPNFKTPTKYAYNAGFQRELPLKLTMMIGYVGYQARHQGRTFAYQDFFPTTIETPGQLPAVNGVPIPGSVVNPNCQVAGDITCYYWAGTPGTNANLLGNIVGTNGATAATVPYATNCTATVVKNCYNNPNWSNSIGGNVFDGTAGYNAIQAVLERRVGDGLFVRTNYTYASCYADSGDNLPGQYTNGGGAAFPLIYLHGAGRGRCAFLGAQNFNMTLTYNIPAGRNSTGFQKMLLANWVITSQTAVGSGVPFTVSAGANVARYLPAANQGGGDRPDWAAPSAACPDPSPNGAINKGNPFNYVKAACFQLAPDGYLGNVKPLIFTGPNLITTDVSLRKTIAVREGKNITLSADMFNIFNRPNFSAPTSLTPFTSSRTANGSFGTIALNNPYQTITTSRQFQINARFTF